jgi:signal peptidase II
MFGEESYIRLQWRQRVARTTSGRKLALIVALLVAADQIAKLWVEANVPLFSRMPLWGESLWLAHYANHGAIGGLGREESWMVPALVAAGALLVVVLLAGYRLYRASVGASWRMDAFLVLSIAALLCTSLDRVRLGYVLDFLHIPGWPVFNFGDLLPNFAVIFLVLELVTVVKRR